MSQDDGDFTDPASRVSWGKASAPNSGKTLGQESASGQPLHKARPEQSKNVTAGALLLLAAIAAGLTWSFFGDWNTAPEVPGFEDFAIGRIVMPALDVALLVWIVRRALAGADHPPAIPVNVVRVGLVLLLVGSAALETTGLLRRMVLAQWGRVPGGPTWEQSMAQEQLQHMTQLSAWLGSAQVPAFFEGSWRRNGHLYRSDVRRLDVRRDGTTFRIRVWHECQAEKAPCDAGEVSAAQTRRADGSIASLEAEVTIPEGRIWLMMGPGKAAHQPAVIVTQVLLPKLPEKRVSSGVGATLLRQKPATPPRELVGEWSRPTPRAIGDFTRITVRESAGQGLAIRAWALCEARRECDLGEREARMELEPDGRVRSAQATFMREPRQLTLTLDPPYQGKFEVESQVSLFKYEKYRAPRTGSQISSNEVTVVGGVATSTQSVVLTPGHPSGPFVPDPAPASPPAASAPPVPGSQIAVPASCATALTLHQAVALDCDDLLGKLTSSQAGALESHDAQGQTPLALAVLRNRHGAAERLLKAGADANAPIRFAPGARPNASGLQRAQKPELAERSTPLIMARDAAMVALLLRYGADTKLKNDYGWSALFYFTHHGSVEMLDALLGAGAEVNDTAIVDPSHAGSTPLMWAAYMNRPAHLQVLLKYKARLDIRDRAGKTALDYARGFGHQEPIRLLTAR